MVTTAVNIPSALSTSPATDNDLDGHSNRITGAVVASLYGLLVAGAMYNLVVFNHVDGAYVAQLTDLRINI